MSRPVCLAVDVMGGDEGPRLALSACQIFSQKHPLVQLQLFGHSQQMAPWLGQMPATWRLVHSEDVISMHQDPRDALRHGQASSLVQALQAVAQQQADAMVSAGNTGALMALARHILGGSPELSRPALCRALPTATGACWMLDLGASLEASPERLQALAAAAAAQLGVGRASPLRVALLNIGTEPTKGPVFLQQAAQLCAQSSTYRFVGFIEPNQLFEGRCDLVVCDGFTGNITLKACEGAARFMAQTLRQALTQSLWGRALGALLAYFLKPWLNRLHPDHLNGALLLGVQGLVVKSHGATSVAGFVAAMEVAYQQACQRLFVPTTISV